MPPLSCAGATSANIKMDLNCCSVILFSLQGPSQLLHAFHASLILLFKVLHCFKSLFVIPWLLFNLDDSHHHLQQHHCLDKSSQTVLGVPVTQSYSNMTSCQLLLSRPLRSPPPLPSTVLISVSIKDRMSTA